MQSQAAQLGSQNSTRLSVHATSSGAHAAKLGQNYQGDDKLDVHAALVGAHAAKLN